MRLQDAQNIALHMVAEKLDPWDRDNAELVVENLLPIMRLRPEVRRVIRWAYGYDGSDRSYEQESDGSSVVKDAFMQGTIKEPPGVGHDYLRRVPGHITPNGQVWTCNQTNWWYYKALRDFGYPLWRAWARYIGLTISRPFWWGTNPVEPK